jgi:hypothetical protein
MTDHMNDPTPTSPAAERMRRHRERQRGGLIWLAIELRATEVDALVRKGFLPEEGREDRDAITRALYEFLEFELDSESCPLEELAHKGHAPRTVTACPPGIGPRTPPTNKRSKR